MNWHEMIISILEFMLFHNWGLPESKQLDTKKFKELELKISCKNLHSKKLKFLSQIWMETFRSLSNLMKFEYVWIVLICVLLMHMRLKNPPF